MDLGDPGIQHEADLSPVAFGEGGCSIWWGRNPYPHRVGYTMTAFEGKRPMNQSPPDTVQGKEDSLRRNRGLRRPNHWRKDAGRLQSSYNAKLPFAPGANY